MELEQLEAAVQRSADSTDGLTTDLAGSERDLLAVLEPASFATLPNNVKEAMEAVHSSLGTDEQRAEAQPSATDPAARGRTCTAEEVFEEATGEEAEMAATQLENDDIMDELDDIDDENDQALLAIARRLKRARQH